MKCGKTGAWLVAVVLGVVAGGVYGEKEVPFVPTPGEVVEEMLRMAEVRPSDVVYDLGCGDGRIVIAAAKKYGARGVGIDIDPERIREARANAEKAGVGGRVKFVQQDLFAADLREATVVTLYLLPDVNKKLRPKLLGELRPGTRVVSHAFDMGEWKADATGEVDNQSVYYWVVPADVQGVWKTELPTANGVQEARIELEQKYQGVGGRVTMGGRTVPISGGKIVGEQLTFTVVDVRGGPGMEYAARVEGRKMIGVYQQAGVARGMMWRGERE